MGILPKPYDKIIHSFLLHVLLNKEWHICSVSFYVFFSSTSFQRIFTNRKNCADYSKMQMHRLYLENLQKIETFYSHYQEYLFIFTYLQVYFRYIQAFQLKGFTLTKGPSYGPNQNCLVYSTSIQYLNISLRKFTGFQICK